MRSRVILALLACVFAASCGRPTGDTAPEPASLVLFCGAGIREAATPLIAAFREETGIEVSPTYAGSGQLLAQISAHQKGDLFMPGAALYVDRAIEKELADADTRRTVACFVPVIFVQKDNPKNIQGLADLTREGVRLGLGDERACAVGKKTVAILEKNGIDLDAVAKNTSVKTTTVNDLGLRIKLGTVDAVILWDANARHFAGDGTVVPIPPEQNLPSTIPIVRLTSSRAPDAAQRFIEFVTSEEGRRIVTGRGYTVDLPEPTEDK